MCELHELCATSYVCWYRGACQGFIGYRDYGDATRFERFAFAGEDSVTRFQRFLRTIICNGGGDGPEDVAGGLQVHRRPSFDADATAFDGCLSQLACMPAVPYCSTCDVS